MTTVVPESRPARLQFLVYVVAFFVGSHFLMISVVMPLWALQLGASPLLIGLIISARQVLVVTMSIHGGALIDRYGPRRMIILLGLAGAALLIAYPLAPLIWATVLIQFMAGWLETTSWIGAQALVGRLLGGGPLYAGRMTAATRFGGFVGPVLAGLVWQAYGSFWGFAFISAWVLVGVFTAWCLPRSEEIYSTPARAAAEVAAAPAPGAVETPRKGVLPSFSDYATTFRLLALPAVALVICCTFMRQAGSGIQSSFDGVWLKEIGFDAAAIGLLIGISNGVSAIAALTVGRAARYVAVHWLLIGMTIIAVAAIAITPVLGTFIALAIAIGLRGWGQGYNFPLMLSLSSQAVGPHLQARVVALRISFNKFGGALVPFIMGAVAEFTGVENAFYIIGAVGVAALVGLGIWAGLSPAFKGRS
jgi:predicted MFS family arabinose efflux permease